MAIRNPYTNKVIFRRIIATELQWIRRSDDMGLIQIPKSQVWVECDSSDSDDSLTKFGPLTTSLVLGQVHAIASPIWRVSLWRNIENFQKLNRMLTGKNENRK